MEEFNSILWSENKIKWKEYIDTLFDLLNADKLDYNAIDKQISNMDKKNIFSEYIRGVINNEAKYLIFINKITVLQLLIKIEDSYQENKEQKIIDYKNKVKWFLEEIL